MNVKQMKKIFSRNPLLYSAMLGTAGGTATSIGLAAMGSPLAAASSLIITSGLVGGLYSGGKYMERKR